VSDAGTLLAMRGIDKAFPGVHALQGVDFSLTAGEIHAIVGENGAGKSTLIKILTGVERPDAGTITLDGQDITVRSPHHAQALGISTVYQEINLCPNLSVGENVLIGRAPRRWGRIDSKALHRRAAEILRGLDIDIDVHQPLGSYSVAIQQMAAIARALEISSARVLILDEPTSSLDAHETEQLFGVMRKLRASGISIVFITHFLDQVYAVADRITVLRNGRLVGTYATAAMPRFELITKMLGRELTELEDMATIKLAQRDAAAGETLLTADGVGREGSIEPFDLELRAGEVVGLAGLLGSGRTEIAGLLFGIEKPDTGSITVNGETVRRSSPLRSIARGVALLPEDRKAEGIVDELTVRENIVLAVQAGRGWLRHMRPGEQKAIADKYIALLKIATPDAEQLVGNLSGGNQQKVILARWLATNPQILILDEPTRGIDIGAKAEVQRLVLALAEDGKSCVFISSELEEVLRTSHRIVVLRDRVKVTEFEGEVDEASIMQAMAGAERVPVEADRGVD
jgi:galactofuranose transport system ATP-binding protein